MTSPFGGAAAAGVTSKADVVAVGSGEHFIVVELAGTDGSLLWRYEAGAGFTRAVAVDAADDVVAAGVLAPPTIDFGGPVVVAKVSGATGSELWRHAVTGTGPTEPLAQATAVVLDASGNAVAAGSVINTGPNEDGIVVKLSASDGSELWRHEVDSGAAEGDAFADLALDPSGDVIASELVGELLGSPITGTVAHLAVVKLSGVTGAQVWRHDGLSAAGVNDAGDVVAAGYGADGTVQSTVLLSGVDGTEVWSHDGAARPVAVRSGGDVVGVDADLTVVALASADGHELWRHAVGCGGDLFEAATVDGAGDVIVAGESAGCGANPNLTNDSFTIAKLSGVTGGELWRRRYEAPPPNRVYDVIVSTPTAFMAAALTTTSGGDVVAAGRRMYDAILQAPVSSFVVQKLTGAEGALLVCGDGYVDPGEECDDGNTHDGDCCSGTCRVEPDGNPCSDGNRCTTNDTCQQAVCRPGPPLPCEPCGTCDPENGCVISTLPVECKAPTESNAAILRLTNRRSNRNDTFRWRWGSGAATSKADFGDPRTTGYAFCIYGPPTETGANVLLGAATPPSRAWHETRRGFEYRRPAGTPDGVRRILLRAGAAGRARIDVAGGGRHLTAPPLPLTEPVTVVARRLDGGACWTASDRLVLKNRTHRFVARGDLVLPRPGRHLR